MVKKNITVPFSKLRVLTITSSFMLIYKRVFTEDTTKQKKKVCDTTPIDRLRVFYAVAVTAVRISF